MSVSTCKLQCCKWLDMALSRSWAPDNPTLPFLLDASQWPTLSNLKGNLCFCITLLYPQMHFQLRILHWQIAKKAVPGHLPVRHWIIRHTLSDVLDNTLNIVLTVVDDGFTFSLIKIHINSEKNPAVSHIIPNSIPQVTSYCKDHPYPMLRSCRTVLARSSFPFQPSCHL